MRDDFAFSAFCRQDDAEVWRNAYILLRKRKVSRQTLAWDSPLPCG